MPNHSEVDGKHKGSPDTLNLFITRATHRPGLKIEFNGRRNREPEEKTLEVKIDHSYNSIYILQPHPPPPTPPIKK